MQQSTRQADSVAAIALQLPEQPTTRDVLLALAQSYRAGWRDALNQSACDLGKALAQVARR